MQADVLVLNGTVVTMDAQRRILKDHGIAVKDGRIAEILPSGELAGKYTAEKTIDAGGKFVYPGFINTHNHLFQMLLKGLGKDQGLIRWLDDCIIANYRHIDKENIYWAALVGCIDQIRTGVTTWTSSMPTAPRAWPTPGHQGVSGCGHSRGFGPRPQHRRLPRDKTPRAPGKRRRVFRGCAAAAHALYKDDPTIQIRTAPGIVWVFSEEEFRRTAELAGTGHPAHHSHSGNRGGQRLCWKT